MNRLITLAVAALVAITAAIIANPAQAGPFETANAYYGNKYGVPDFTFTKSEFGNTTLGQLIHLGAEVVVEKVKGATVVYNPATGEVNVWGTIPASKGTQASTYPAYSKCFGTYGFIDSLGACIPGSSVGSESSPASTVLLSTTPGTPRTCSFDAGKDGKDVHSC